MEPIDMYVVTKWSLSIKKITVAYQVKEQNYSLNDFPLITLEFPAEADHWATVYVQMWIGVFVT